MFGKEKLEFRIAELQDDIADLQKSNDEVKQKQRNVVYDDIDGSAFIFDWAGARVFSIERNFNYVYDELVAYTGIGYNLNPETGTSEEWHLMCSQEEHNRLAAEFKEYLASKRGAAVAKPMLLTETKPATRVKK